MYEREWQKKTQLKLSTLVWYGKEKKKAEITSCRTKDYVDEGQEEEELD